MLGTNFLKHMPFLRLACSSARARVLISDAALVTAEKSSAIVDVEGLPNCGCSPWGLYASALGVAR